MLLSRFQAFFEIFGNDFDGFVGIFLDFLGAVTQVVVFAFRKFRVDYAVDAAFADNGRQRKADVFDAFDVVVVGGYGQNGIFVIGYGLADLAQRAGNAVEGGAFAVDNLVGGIADAVVDMRLDIGGKGFVFHAGQFFNLYRTGVAV